jgi:hypothetical protein
MQFITTAGLSEFIYELQSYDPYSPWAANNDDANGDDGNNGGDWDYDNLPMCEGDNGYIGVGCSGTNFVLEYYNDAYCLSPSGTTYDKLSTLNSKLSYYSNCATIYQDGYDYNVAEQLMAYSTSCSSLDSGYCTDSSYMSSRRGGSGSVFSKGTKTSGYYKSWGTKAKYVMGGLLLLAAFIMFTGILFTNRRRRRALLQRKFRQRSRSHRSRKSSKSRSKSRDGRSSSSRRTKSKSRSSSRAPTSDVEGEGGVLT